MYTSLHNKKIEVLYSKYQSYSVIIKNDDKYSVVN